MPDPIQGETPHDPKTTPPEPSGPGSGPVAEEPKPEMVELVVHGTKRLLTQAQVVERAQKHAAGEDTLKEAAEFKKNTLTELADMKKDAKVGALLQKAYQDKDAEAYKELLLSFGYDDKAATAAVQEMTVQSTPNPVLGEAPENPTAAHGAHLAALETQLAEQAAELTRLSQQDTDRSTAQMEVELRAKVKDLVDTDEALGYIVKKAGPRAEKVHELAWRAVERRILDTAARGEKVMDPDLLTDAIAEVRSVTKDLGVTDQMVGQIPGLAPTPLSLDGFHPEKPPERKPMTDRDWSQSLTDRMRHQVIASALKSQ